DADYRITIDDGGSQGADGQVLLNGEVLLKPREGGEAGPRRRDIDLKLQSKNVLEVRLTGRPGSTLTVTLRAGAKEIGAAGGRIVVPGSEYTVEFPPQALASPTVIQVAEVPTQLPNQFQLVPLRTVELQPSGLNLLANATVTWRYGAFWDGASA